MQKQHGVFVNWNGRSIRCIIRSEFIFSFAGKTELSCKIIDADDEWIKICYTEKKDKQVVKLMRIENIESIEEQ